MTDMVAINGSDSAAMAIMERVLLAGDLAKLEPGDRVLYFKAVCESVGLNPLTKPLEYIYLNGKLTLYANRGCTDQLRSLHNVSVTSVVGKMVGDLYVVTAEAKDKTGRTDVSTAAVHLGEMKGEMRANALMKCETKAKRRVTLSLCGLGYLDETEIDSIPEARRPSARPKIDYETGVIEETEAWTGSTSSPRSSGSSVESSVSPSRSSFSQTTKEEMIKTIQNLAERKRIYGRERAKIWDDTLGDGVTLATATLDQLIAVRDALEQA